MLTERQAWTRIAEAFARYETTGERGGLSMWGLRTAVDDLAWSSRIGLATRQRMARTVQQTLDEKCALDGFYDCWLAPMNADGAGLRAMLATLFAEASR